MVAAHPLQGGGKDPRRRRERPPSRRFFGDPCLFMLRNVTKPPASHPFNRSGLPLTRVIALALAAARIVVGTALDRLTRRGADADALLAHRVRKAFERLGPTFVKAGQLMSSSAGPLSQTWVNEMAHCRDDVPPAPWRSVSELLAEELGANRAELVDVDPEPLAAGSMAQVHTARLADGTPVVVKVQRPGLEKLLSEDIRLLRTAARLAARFSSACAAANPMALVDDFARGLEEQLSFRGEAANARGMALALSSLPVKVPAVYEELSTERVLVMERLRGARADDVEAVEGLGIDRSHVVESVISALLVPALGSGVFHADMHPGNMLVLDDGRLGLLDFGVIAHLDDIVRPATSDLLAALAEGRFGDAVMAMFQIVDPSGIDLTSVIPQVQALIGEFIDKPLAGIDVRDAIGAILQLASRNGFALPESLVAFFKQMLYISGLCRTLSPDFDVLGDIAPILGLAREPELAAA